MFPTQTIKIRLNTTTNHPCHTHPPPKEHPRARRVLPLKQPPVENALYVVLPLDGQRKMLPRQETRVAEKRHFTCVQLTIIATTLTHVTDLR